MILIKGKQFLVSAKVGNISMFSSVDALKFAYKYSKPCASLCES